MYGFLSSDYCMNILNLITERIKEFYIFVFSNDISCAKKNLKSALRLYFVKHNDNGQDYKGIHLMSRFKHHIITNIFLVGWAHGFRKILTKL